MRKLFTLFATIALTSTMVLASQQAPDVTGLWSGTMLIPQDGKRVKATLHATFRQTQDELTGSIGPEPNAQLAIARGRVESTKFGTVITFSMKGDGFVMHFELRPDGGALRGLARLEGQPGKAPVELEMVK